MKQIRKVAVLGAGTMGSQIAAHLANAGFKVVLLDIVPDWLFNEEQLKESKNRNHLALNGLKTASSLKPAPFALPEFASSIEVGNFTDDMEKIKDADWVIEVVKEDLEVKRKLMEKVSEYRQPGSIVSSNTSGISLSSIVQGFPQEFKSHFLGTHFFNPPRYLPLVEVASIKETLPEITEFMKDFLDRKLGKTVVPAKDTPDFIANRIAVPCIMKILQVMLEHGYSIEEVDKITGKAIGWPKSATFRTLDIVGLDVFNHVVQYLYEHIPHDLSRDILKMPDFVNKMLEKGLLGQKVKKGFYQSVKKQTGDREIMVLDFDTFEYRAMKKVSFADIETGKNITDTGERIKFLFNGKDRASQFVHKIFLFMLVYAAQVLEEIADDIISVDTALKNGFMWELGPFEVWDAIGVENIVEELKNTGTQIPQVVEELLKSGNKSFYQRKDGKTYFFDFKEKNFKEIKRPDGIIVLRDLKEQNKVIEKNNEASLINLGDGVACLEFHSKMNAIGPGTISMMKHAAREVMNNEKFKGLVIANQGENFSVGANLDLIKESILNDEFEEIDLFAKDFQNACMELKYMPKPVVAAPFGWTFGAGCEICLHADRICAAHETYMGLVEIGVGVIPAGGGTKEVLLRNLEKMPKDLPPGIEIDPMPFIVRALMTILRPDIKVSTSAFQAKQIGYLRQGDVIVMNKNRLIAEAKNQVLALSENYQPPRPEKIILYGQRINAALKTMIYLFKEGRFMTEHEALIAEKLTEILTGGNLSEPVEVSEQYILDQERKVFIFLCRQKKTQERIFHMLKTGKPLRN